MTVWGLWRGVALAGFVTLLAAIAPLSAQAQRDDIDALNREVAQLYQAGQYPKATELAKQLVELSERKFGPDHPNLAVALNNLALLYDEQGRYPEAEPLYERVLTIDEKALGPDHPDVATALNNLAWLYYLQGRYAEGEALYKRSLAIREKAFGPDHPDVAQSLNNLARLYQTEGHYADAESRYKRALAIREKTLGPDHPQVGLSLNNLAGLFRDQGRYAEAEPLYKRDMAITKRTLGPDHPEVGRALGSLALLYRHQGRYDEAEPLFKQALAIMEKAFGSDHKDVGLGLYNLADLYQALGRYVEAEPLLERALAIREKALGRDHPEVGESRYSLALVYQSEGRYDEAEPLFKQALVIAEKALGPLHPNVGTYLNSLADLHRAQGRFAEAELSFKQALAMTEKALGPDHDYVATVLNNLAALYHDQGRYAEAEPLLERALAIKKNAFGPDHPDVDTPLSNLAFLFFEQRNWRQAADYWRRGTSAIVRRAERGTGAGGEILTRRRKSEAHQLSFQFFGLVKAVHRLASEDRSAYATSAREMFEAAQWAQASDAASSLAQMAARSAKGDTALAKLARERQDLVGEWQAKDKQLIAAKSQLPVKRDADAEKGLSDRLEAIDARLKAIDGQFAKDFPEYASLTSPKPTSVAKVQALLQPNEVLVLFLDTFEWKPVAEETFIWAITKSDVRWVKSELGTKALTERVAALRCGLDAAFWDDESAAARCRSLVKPTPERDAHGNVRYETLPFDTTRANALYEALFGPIADVIRDKRLLIVPSGALTQLPFQVLVTDKPDPALSGTEALHRAAWLARSHALTVLPSVSSLKALRQLAKESHANRTLIGFGNPLLNGPDAGYAALAAAARSKTSCPELPKQRIAELTGKRRGVLPLGLRSGLADAGEIRSQVPLPETADELCAVARDLRVSDKDVWLGKRATEAEIKRLSEAGELAKYRIVHFATHGALAGQVGGNSEPGLILTPPDTVTEGDDGYLSASEITTLKLDADWVILSACNTAAGGAEGAEALSGLARAFFYAGARALLVSHWAVNSDATVKLITGAVGRMAAHRRIGRAEAMRQSMVALIDKGEAYEAHPAIWAPFVVVGEGAAAK
jgi:tetratricopeptide (TPR) repeat protein/CHAT domain-containing protein